MEVIMFVTTVQIKEKLKMSRAIALVKFNKTENIYMGVYDGTVDVLVPVILPPEKCLKDDGCYHTFDSIEEAYNQFNTDDLDYTDSDIDDVEIYSDYGGGFFWDGKGVEKYGYILNDYLAPFMRTYHFVPWDDSPDDSILVVDGKPEWVEEFMDNLFKE